MIYYAELPNEYLAAIAKHGIHYRQQFNDQISITLRRTEVYHLRKTVERAKVFTLLAKLVWYLLSGRSHVGYLRNTIFNPIHVEVWS